MWPCVWVKAWCPCVSWCECCGCCPRARVTRPRDTWHANYIQNRASLCPASAVSHTFYITTSHAPTAAARQQSQTNQHFPTLPRFKMNTFACHHIAPEESITLTCIYCWINICQNVVYILSVSLLSPLCWCKMQYIFMHLLFFQLVHKHKSTEPRSSIYLV